MTFRNNTFNVMYVCEWILSEILENKLLLEKWNHFSAASLKWSSGISLLSCRMKED